MNTVDSGVVSEWQTNFFRAVPPHWCKLRRTLEVMPGNVNSSVFKNRLTSTYGCGKVETGLFCVLDYSTLIYYKLQSGWRKCDHGKLN